MKKYILAIIAVLLFILPAQAQLGFAPELGLNLSTLREQRRGRQLTDNYFRPGARVGALLFIYIVKGLSIQPGLFYSMKGSNFRNTDGATTTEAKLNLNYLEVPVNAVYKFSRHKGGFFVLAGPCLAYALSGTQKTTSTTGSFSRQNTYDVSFGDNPGQIKRLDVGANIGMGYMLQSGGYVRVQYAHGLTNLIQKDAGEESRNACFSLSIGFMVGSR